jgi:hypothetical protein
MAGHVPAIYALLCSTKTWMPGTSPGMTTYCECFCAVLSRTQREANSPHHRIQPLQPVLHHLLQIVAGAAEAGVAGGEEL